MGHPDPARLVWGQSSTHFIEEARNELISETTPPCRRDEKRGVKVLEDQALKKTMVFSRWVVTPSENTPLRRVSKPGTCFEEGVKIPHPHAGVKLLWFGLQWLAYDRCCTCRPRPIPTLARSHCGLVCSGSIFAGAEIRFSDFCKRILAAARDATAHCITPGPCQDFGYCSFGHCKSKKSTLAALVGTLALCKRHPAKSSLEPQPLASFNQWLRHWRC
jgi:hypothetical protein